MNVPDLSSLATKFRAAFIETFPSVQRDDTREGNRFLRVPAAHPDVGDLLVWDDDEELTIGIGEHHHGHHSLYMYDDLPNEEAEHRVVEEALDFVRALFAERVVLGLSWEGERLRWSRTYYLDHHDDFRGAVGYREYFWTGPRPDVGNSDQTV